MSAKSNDPEVKAVWGMMARSKVEHNFARQYRRSDTTRAKSHAHNAIKHMVRAAEYAQEHLTSEEQRQRVHSVKDQFSPALFRCMQHALEGGSRRKKRHSPKKIAQKQSERALKQNEEDKADGKNIAGAYGGEQGEKFDKAYRSVDQQKCKKKEGPEQLTCIAKNLSDEQTKKIRESETYQSLKSMAELQTKEAEAREPPPSPVLGERPSTPPPPPPVKAKKKTPAPPTPEILAELKTKREAKKIVEQCTPCLNTHDDHGHKTGISMKEWDKLNCDECLDKDEAMGSKEAEQNGQQWVTFRDYKRNRSKWEAAYKKLEDKDAVRMEAFRKEAAASQAAKQMEKLEKRLKDSCKVGTLDETKCKGDYPCKDDDDRCLDRNGNTLTANLRANILKGGGGTALAAMHAGDRTPEVVLAEWKRSLDALRAQVVPAAPKEEVKSFLSGTELHWSDLRGGGDVVGGDLLRLSDMVPSEDEAEEESMVMEFDLRSEKPAFW